MSDSTLRAQGEGTFAIDGVAGPPRKSTPFAPYHKWDRNFFLAIVALIWFGILMGFVPEIIAHIRENQPAFPLIVHVHAVAFVGWLVLLTTQLMLVRFGRTDLHRKLGVAGAVLAAIMMVLGVTTAMTVDYRDFVTPDADPGFLAIQLGDLLVFGPLVAAAVLLRNTPSAHKRLMLLATIFICDAGFARFWGGGIGSVMGHGYWGKFTSLYISDPLLAFAIGGYDLITRRRLHPACVAGLCWGLAVEFTAIWLYVSPWWKPIATMLIGR